jgi:4-amino-4-deoxy-L-arabinose transferase-like glycosyltransferase
MTSILDEPTSVVDQRRDPAPSAAGLSWSARCRGALGRPAVVAVLIGVAATALRLIAAGRSYDIFIDEVTYTKVADNLAHGSGVVLYGQPFFVHPPAAFGLLAMVIVVFNLHGTTEHLLFDLRSLDAVLGGLTCAATFLLVRRAGGAKVALLAAALLALDPFVISYDSRVMLEAPAQLAAVASVLALARALERGAGSSARRRWLVASGLLAACVLCTKETFGLVIGLLVVLLWVTGWVVARREAAAVAGVAVGGYLLNVVLAGATGGFAGWWDANTEGLQRLIGTKKITGFTAPTTHVTLVSRVFANASQFGVTYAVLAAGTVSAVVLVWRHRRARSAGSGDERPGRVRVLLGLWALSGAAYLAYATLFGSIEEQMYYIVVLPALACLCLVAAPLVRQGRLLRRAAVVALLVGALVVDGTVWLHVHSRRDDEYRTFLAWESRHVRPDRVIAVTEDTAQFLLGRAVLGQWNTPAELRQHRVGYVLLATSLVAQGYGDASPSFERFVEHHGTPAFAADGPSDGSLRLYDVARYTGGRS